MNTPRELRDALDSYAALFGKSAARALLFDLVGETSPQLVKPEDRRGVVAACNAARERAHALWLARDKRMDAALDRAVALILSGATDRDAIATLNLNHADECELGFRLFGDADRETMLQALGRLNAEDRDAVLMTVVGTEDAERVETKRDIRRTTIVALRRRAYSEMELVK